MRKAYIVHAAIVADTPEGEKKGKVLEIKNDFGRSFFAIKARVAETQHI